MARWSILRWISKSQARSARTSPPNDDVTSVCRYMGHHSDYLGRLVTEKLLCRHDDPPIDRKASVLQAEKCPEKKQTCVGCVHIENIIIPSEPNPEKSHASVVCGLVKAEK